MKELDIPMSEHEAIWATGAAGKQSGAVPPRPLGSVFRLHAQNAAFALAGLTIGCASTPTGQATAATTTTSTISNNQQSGDQTLDEQIKNLMQTYQRSLNESNLDLLRSVYAEDAVFIGQPFPTATGKDAIVALYADFLSKLDFNVEFEILEVELSDNLGFVRTQSVGTIVPKGQTPGGTERNREVFVVKRIDNAWKIYRYIFNPEV